MRFISSIVSALFLVLSSVNLSAEPSWKNLESEHCLVYFQDGNEAVANRLLQDLDEQYSIISDLIGFPSPHKWNVVIAPTKEDNTQGETLINSLLENGEENQFIFGVVATSDYELIKKDLLKECSKTMLSEMFYGGSTKEFFKGKAKRLPEWFVEGAAEYVATREAVKQLELTNKPEKLKGAEAAAVGQSFWYFVSKQYGTKAISNMLNYARITRKEEKSIEITVGMSYAEVMNDWQAFYSN